MDDLRSGEKAFLKNGQSKKREKGELKLNQLCTKVCPQKHGRMILQDIDPFPAFNLGNVLTSLKG